MKKFMSIIMAFMMFLVMSASNLCYVFAETVDSKEETEENEAVTLADTSSNDYVWQLVTDGNIDTGEYLIVSNNNAMQNNSGNIGSESVIISNNEIESATSDSQWRITKNTNNYTIKSITSDSYLKLERTGNKWNNYKYNATLDNNTQNVNISSAILDTEAFIVSANNAYLGTNFQGSSNRFNYIYFYKKVQKVNLNVEYYLDGEKVDSSSSKVVDGKATTISSPYANSEEYIFEKMVVNNGNESTEENYTININGDTTVKYYYKKAQLVSFTVNFYVNGNKQESDTISKNVKDGTTQTVAIPSKYNHYTFTKMTVNEKESTNIDKTIEIKGDTVVSYYYSSDSDADAYLPDGDLNGADQPEYPDQGAVRLNKSATSDIFNETGLTRVELGVTGVPIKRGTDVVLVIDTSGSMQYDTSGKTASSDSQKRIYIAKQAAIKFVDKIFANNADGSKSNNRVSVVVFSSTGDSDYRNEVVCNLKNADNKQVVKNAINGISNKCKGGTDYDKGMGLADGVLRSQKTSDATGYAKRNHAVLFMSDGAPTNGFNGTSNANTIDGYTHHNASKKIKDELNTTIYTVGFCLSKVDDFTVEICESILRDKMASSADCFKSVTTAGALDTAFQDIATSIKKAGTEAKLTDTIGDAFELQMATPSHATSFDTSIKVLSYDLDANGNRTGTPEELEKITFNSTGTSATSSLKGSENILSNGKINAEKFTYNIATKTFTWKIGDITSKEVVLSFAEYLTGSMSDEGVKKDNYPTNKGDATLTYKSYKDKNETKNIKPPVLPWGNAFVKVQYYLVNDEGKPVNSAGVVVPEGFKVIVDEKDVSINIGQDTTINANDANYLPSGYELLNTDAYYTITNPGQSSANQSSSNGTDADKGSTLVSGDKPYATSTVAFGVKAKTSLTPDSIVLDYGKPITFNVLANDGLKNTTLTGIAKKNGTTLNTDLNTGVSSSPNNAFTGEATDEYGKAVKKNNTGDVTYTLSKYMSGIDKFYYEVTGTTTNSEGQKDDFYKYSSISVIPATSVYYEDNFGDASTNTNGTTNGIIFNGNNWTTVTDEDYYDTDKKEQDSDQGSDATYGQDSSYAKDKTFSYGSAHKVTAEKGAPASAKFIFKGTGFELISRTDNDTGNMSVKVYDSNNTLVKNIPVNTKYETGGGVLYQIPVISVTDLPYDQYKVVITVSASTNSAGVTTPSTVYIDGIRLYNPIDPESEDAKEANEQYKTDKEANAIVKELRNLLLKKEDLKSDTNANGIVYVDATGDTAEIKDYEDLGPNNEVYLSSGNSIGFKLKSSKPASIKIGAKAPSGSTKVAIGSNSDSSKDFILNSATDMYYDVTNAIVFNNDGEAYVVITNVGDSDAIVSLTNIKFTYDESPTVQPSIVSNEEVGQYAVKMTLSRNNVEDTDSSTGSNDTEDNIQDKPTEKPSDDKNNTLDKVVNTIKNTIKNLFSKWFK